MKKTILKLDVAGTNYWQTVIKNNHARKVYLKLTLVDNQFVKIIEAFYIDRPWKSVSKSMPLKLTTTSCKLEDLQDVLAKELDKKFCGIEFIDDGNILSTEEYIESFLDTKKKYKFLILVKSGNVLKTRFKNRTHRTIYLEIKKDDIISLVSNCYYCDRYYKRDKTLIIPSGLTTIYFEYGLDAILKIVNEELNCDFTDVIITKDSFGFEETNIPVCGSI